MKLTEDELLYLMQRFPIDDMPDDIFIAVFSYEELTEEQVRRIQPAIQKHMLQPRWL